MKPGPLLSLVDRSDLLEIAVCPACYRPLPRRRRREAWIEVPVDGGWIAAYRVVVKNRRPLIAEARLFPSERGHRLAGSWSEEARAVPPGRALRSLRLKDPIGLLPKFIRNWEDQQGRAAADHALGQFGISRARPLAPRRPGRAGRPETFYALWAAAYVERLRAGSPHPVKDLAARAPIRIEGYVSTGGAISVLTVRDIVHQARERGFLTPSPPGRAGGELTAKAERILQQRPRRRPTARRE